MQWRIGDVTVTKIVELEVTGGSRFILPQATREAIQPIAWLRPHFADEDGRLRMSIHSFVVETPTRRIIVDTCLGNDKQNRRIPTWNDLHGPFLADLAAAGYPRESIDTVLCTHLHVDHVGWNTMLVDGRWVPTFPRARYLMGRIEYEHWSQPQGREDMVAVFGDSVAAGVRRGAGRSGGDRRAHLRRDRPGPDDRPYAGPCQRAHPLARRGGADHRRLHAPPVSDRASRMGIHGGLRSRAGQRTREFMFERLAGTPVLVIGTHFAGATAGRIVRDGAAYRLEV